MTDNSMQASANTDLHRGSAPLAGILAEFDGPGALKKAAVQVRDAGFTRWDCYSPFPVHGIDPAMGVRPTILPWIILGMGLTGLGIATALQWWTNAVDYPFLISGKPLFGLPANIPIMFELTILLSAFGAFFGALLLNDLPRFYRPIFSLKRFRKATDSGFFIGIEASDPKFDSKAIQGLFNRMGSLAIEEYRDSDSRNALPKPFLRVGIILFLLGLIPLAFAVKSRHSTSTSPRWHFWRDMDFQPLAKAQRASVFFPDGRAIRPQVEGTLAREQADNNPHLNQGRINGKFAKTFPIPLSMEMLERGKDRFDTYCAPCHGRDGKGQGLVATRAASLGEGTWVPPTNLIDARIQKMSVGEIYQAIRYGVRNMPKYGPQIEVRDRWAIVAYIRALQRSLDAKINDVPEADRGKLK
jgi:mono/diheme cytochrome c family protein